MLKNPYNNLLFDHIDGFEFFLIFLVQILSYLPLLQEGTTAEFPALGSSHNRPWLRGIDTLTLQLYHNTSCHRDGSSSSERPAFRIEYAGE